MSNRRTIAGFAHAALALMLAGCQTSGISSIDARGRLTSCGIKGTPFEERNFEDWSGLYHQTVDNIIEADLESIAKRSCVISDDATSARPVPTSALKALAETLPPWKVQSSLATLSQDDLAAVLLEYLRTYECAMAERESTSIQTAASEAKNSVELLEKATTIQTEIQQERATARTALNRTLTIVSGLHRLDLLAMNTDCLARISLDLRNNFSLLSEVGACLPRTQDGRQSLDDLPSGTY